MTTAGPAEVWLIGEDWEPVESLKAFEDRESAEAVMTSADQLFLLRFDGRAPWEPEIVD